MSIGPWARPHHGCTTSIRCWTATRPDDHRAAAAFRIGKTTSLTSLLALAQAYVASLLAGRGLAPVLSHGCGAVKNHCDLRRPVASIIDDLVAGNQQFVKERWDPAEAEMLALPARKLAIVACMDTRHAVEGVLGLQHGDAKIIRNAGNIIDDGTLRSLLVAVHLLGVRHIVVMGHTKCGMLQVGHGDFRIAHSIAETTDTPLHAVMRPDFQRWLGGFDDVEGQVERSVELLRQHPYLPNDIEVGGLVYDNDSGRVRRVGG